MPGAKGPRERCVPSPEDELVEYHPQCKDSRSSVAFVESVHGHVEQYQNYILYSFLHIMEQRYHGKPVVLLFPLTIRTSR